MAMERTGEAALMSSSSWFLELNIEDPAFDQSSFAKNRERLLKHDVSRLFFEAVLNQARQLHLLSTSTSPWTAPCPSPGPRSRA